MTISRPRVHSDLPIPPGEILEEEIEARGMTQKELAARLSRPAQVINEIIRGKKAITAETAIGLGKVLGIDAQFWMNLESNYRITLARKREEGPDRSQRGMARRIPDQGHAQEGLDRCRTG